VLQFWVVTLGCALLAGVGIALEVARHLSAKHNGVSWPSRISGSCADPIYSFLGFFVPEKNVFSFASVQFLTVSVQTLLLDATDCLSYNSHSSHLSSSFPLHSWSIPLTGPSDCGMYAFNTLPATPHCLTRCTALHHPVSRTCQGRRNPLRELRRLIPLFVRFLPQNTCTGCG
jgi:hypothetical protein